MEDDELYWVVCRKETIWRWKNVDGKTQWISDGYRFVVLEPEVTKKYELEQ